MPEPQKGRPRPIREHREGAISLRFYKFEGQEFWRLARDTAEGAVEIAVGRAAELPAIAKVLRGAREAQAQERPRPERRETLWSRAALPLDRWWSRVRNAWKPTTAPPEPPPRRPPQEGEPAKKQKWVAVIRLNEVTKTAARGYVVTSFDEPGKARTCCDKNKRLALYTTTFDERPAKRTPVEVRESDVEALNRKGEGQDLAYQFRFLRWQRAQGIFHNRGIWNDQHEGPRLGQPVRFTTGLDYRGEPEQRRVEPLRPIEPGPPAKPQEVVYRMSRKHWGVGWIVALPDGPQEAEKEMRGRDEKQLFREQVLNQKEWEKFAVGSPELRALADREMPQWKLTTHVRGSSRIETIERTEDGAKQRTHIVRHDVREADGRIRTTGMVLTSEDLKALREVLEVRQEQRQERTKTHRPQETQQPKTAETPAKHQVEQGLSMRP